MFSPQLSLLKILKDTISDIAEPLAHIFNLSFSTGMVPAEMKIGKITPIYKSGNQNLFSNYRPISILPAISKILEKLVCRRLMKFLDINKILYNYQFGFRPKHSTIHPIVHFLQDIAEENDKPSKDKTIAVFLDLSKAFDTINHETLLHKLNFYGIRGLCNAWFKNYLSDRKQYLEYHNTKSNLEDITCGVPQGSILGPIFFLLYINDIKNCTTSNLVSFADDTTIYYSSPNQNELFQKVNEELIELYDWLCVNKLSLNISKTIYSIFGPSVCTTESRENTPMLNNIPIIRPCNSDLKNPIKFLGICLDDTLTWQKHISYLSSKLARSIYIINRVKNVLPHSALLSLYYALFHSHIMYGIQLWGHSAPAKKIYNMQKKIVRIINNKSYRSHTDPLFKKCQLLKLEDLYTLQVALFMHDYKYDRLPPSFTDIFQKNTFLHGRHANNFPRYRPRTLFTANLPRHNFPKTWNDLNPDLKNISSRNIFKRQLKTQFLNHYNSKVKCKFQNCPDCFPK